MSIKCDVCGRFISCRDLDEGVAIHQMMTPDSEYSTEEFMSLCKDHYVVPPPKRIIDEDVHPIKWLKSIIMKLNKKD